MFYMIFFKEQKRDMTSSVTWPERFEYLRRFLKYIFRVVVLSTNIYTVLPLSNYTSIFKAKANEDWARTLKLRNFIHLGLIVLHPSYFLCIGYPLPTVSSLKS